MNGTWRGDVHIDLVSFPDRRACRVVVELIDAVCTPGHWHDLASFDVPYQPFFDVQVLELGLKLLTSTKIDKAKCYSTRQRIDFSFDWFVIHWLPTNLRNKHFCYFSELGSFIEQASANNCCTLNRQVDINCKRWRHQTWDVHAQSSGVLRVHWSNLRCWSTEQDANRSGVVDRLKMLIHVWFLETV